MGLLGLRWIPKQADYRNHKLKLFTIFTLLLLKEPLFHILSIQINLFDFTLIFLFFYFYFIFAFDSLSHLILRTDAKKVRLTFKPFLHAEYFNIFQGFVSS